MSYSHEKKTSYVHYNLARDRCHQLSMFQTICNFNYHKDHSPMDWCVQFNYFLTRSSSAAVILHSSSVQPKSHGREIPCQSFPPRCSLFKLNKFALKIIKIFWVRFITCRPGQGNLKQLIKSPAVSQHSEVVSPDAEKSL